jgi:hypothetical protein
VATPQQAQRKILAALSDHFNRSDVALSPDEVAELTALPLEVVQNGLRVLHKADKIEGIMVAELPYPVQVTGIVYHPVTAAASLVATATLTVGAEVVAPPESTSYGFPVTRTFTIKEGINAGIHQYDLIENGEVIWHGLGTDPVDGLLKIIIHQTEGPDPNFPKE